MKKALFAAACAAVLTIGGAAAPTAHAAHPGKLLPPPANAVPGVYVVVLDDDVVAVDNVAADLAGHRVARTWRTALRGFTMTGTPADARRVAADRRVRYVQQDGRVKASVAQPIPAPPNSWWGLGRIDQHFYPGPGAGTYSYFWTGAGVHAYVIDTGIRTDHTQFAGRATFDYSDPALPNPGVDCNGHGTHVAGTIGGATYGVAKAVKLHAVKVLDCGGSGTFSGVITGVDWVTANAPHPAVANMSLGGGAYPALDAAVNNSIVSGITYSLAGGNSNDNACNYSPARALGGITSGATGDYAAPAAPITDGRSSYSNWGPCLDLFAPGSYIRSSWIGSTTDAATLSGTSMAAPHVAGVAALYLQAAPAAHPTQVTDALVELSTKGLVGGEGPGSPDRLLYGGGPSGITLDSTEPVLKGGLVTSAGVLSLNGLRLAGRTVQFWFDPLGAAPPVLRGTATTNGIGQYSRAFTQSADGWWTTRYLTQPLIVGSSAIDYVDCSNC